VVIKVIRRHPHFAKPALGSLRALALVVVFNVVVPDGLPAELAILRLRTTLSVGLIVHLGYEDQAERTRGRFRATLLVNGQKIQLELVATEPTQLGLAANGFMAG